MPLTVFALLGCGYASLHLAQVPRSNRATGLFYWPAPRIAAWAHTHKIAWLERHDVPEKSLHQVDLATGKFIRRVCTLEFLTSFPISPSPDGRIAVTTGSRGELTAIDLATGWTTRSVERLTQVAGRAGRGIAPGWRHVAGWFDAKNVCVQYFDLSQGRHDVYRWNVRNGDLQELLTTTTSPPGASLNPTTFYLVPGTSQLALAVPDRFVAEAKYGDKSTIQVRNLADGTAIAGAFEDQFWAGCAPVPIGDGDRFYIRGWGAPDILLYSISAAARVGQLPAPGFMGTLQDGPAGLAYHAATKRLFVATSNPDAVHVRDTIAKRWIARLDFGMSTLPDDYIAISPDGRWVAIRVSLIPGRFPTTAPRTFKQHLLIFDLTRLDKPVDPPAK